MRVVDIAAQMTVTRQAVSQLVGEIEGRGYLERVPDPSDGRAVLVRHTAAGRRLLAEALAAMTAIEDEWQQVVGVRQMDQVRRSLTAIADHVEPTWRFAVGSDREARRRRR